MSDNKAQSISIANTSDPSMVEFMEYHLCSKCIHFDVCSVRQAKIPALVVACGKFIFLTKDTTDEDNSFLSREHDWIKGPLECGEPTFICLNCSTRTIDPDIYTTPCIGHGPIVQSDQYEG